MNCKLLIIVAAAGLGIAATPDRFDLKVRNYFFAGFSGDSESLDKGMKMCEETLAEDSKNAQALVWHGAGLYFRSGQLFQQGDPQKGMELMQRGIGEMDQAVELAPDSVGVRIPRGAVLLTGSRFIPDPAIARPLVVKALSDFERSYELQLEQLDRLGTHPRGDLLIGLAEANARLGNDEKAGVFYDRLEKDLPGTPYAKKAAQYRETKVTQTGCLGCHNAK